MNPAFNRNYFFAPNPVCGMSQDFQNWSWNKKNCRQPEYWTNPLVLLLGNPAVSRIGGKGGMRQFPPVLLAARSCDVGPLGVSGGWPEKWPPSFPCRESTLEG